jgi:hypothetical protein
MQTVQQDQLWDVLRGGEWCRARDNSATGNTATVTLSEMMDSAKFRFVADGAEPPA